MNIKTAPCLARIAAPKSKYNGWIVSVLSAAPLTDFLLPDGYPADGRPEAWLCESLMHSCFEITLATGTVRKTRYVVIEDRGLRPLHGLETPTRVEDEVTA